MGSFQPAVVSPSSSEDDADNSISDIEEKFQLEVENLTLTTQPFRTLQLFILATVDYLKKSLSYALEKGGWFMVLSVLLVGLGLVLLTVDGPHEKEFLQYFRFGLWWVALGVASSIGLGSGLHTFVLYLGPHIAFFTIKAVQCGRVDLKSATYDTIQLKRGPSWLERDCSSFGPPVFPSSSDSLVTVPLSSILPQVQMEAILWGLGTALGELPPYFISRAASLSGSRLDAVEEIDTASSNNGGFISSFLNRIKRWLLLHAQHLNFFTILLLASVPNPLFDLAGIMCGQFGIPFWKFFFATLTGKALIKTHIQASLFRLFVLTVDIATKRSSLLQTIFIIALCNNQLLALVENELIWILGHIPGFSSVSMDLSSTLHMVKEKYLSPRAPGPANTKEKQWNLSFNLIWNSVVWLMLLNFFVKIVTSTAQRYRRKEQEQELAKLSALRSNGATDHVSASMKTDKGKKENNSKKKVVLPLEEGEGGGSGHLLRKHEHRIVFSDVVFKNRWSDVNSADLISLKSEMLNLLSSKRFSSTTTRLCHNCPSRLSSSFPPDD
ncbi:hypothetical protein Taro_029095 [Colocasia esculenta]|uniref:Vacuole membrane protein KMS1 n=1 Tax=Colocasia esculenta TaxID=4460 RepID=A0A843VQ35_COLES|nr:hypothetical protein [Colocasia esculenta]